jgi:hypothetical protein
MEVGVQLHDPATLPPRKELRYLRQEVVRPPELVLNAVKKRKNPVPLSGMNPNTEKYVTGEPLVPLE